MTCYHPVKAWRSRETGSNGRFLIVFNEKDGYSDLPLDLPCGKCVGCSMDRAGQWAARCYHESQLHDENMFLTITYDDLHLPFGGNMLCSDNVVGTLKKSDLQKFFKRYRKAVNPHKIRYFACGEYGDDTQRPHYHALIFGHAFPDLKKIKSLDENSYLQSEKLNEIWGKGSVIVGSVAFASCAYVSGYVIKKQEKGDAALCVVNEETGEILERESEFVCMSRRPGIGADWFARYGSDVFPDDFVVVGGQKYHVPRYYEKLATRDDEKALRSVLRKRKTDARNRTADNTPQRLAVREKVAIAKRGLRKSGKI